MEINIAHNNPQLTAIATTTRQRELIFCVGIVKCIVHTISIHGDSQCPVGFVSCVLDNRHMIGVHMFICLPYIYLF